MKIKTAQQALSAHRSELKGDIPIVSHIGKHAYKDDNVISEDAESPEKLFEDNQTNLRSRKNKGTFDLVSEEENNVSKELKQI